MWPFRNNAPKTQEQPLVPPIAIGQRFKYLGVDMICIRHWEFGTPFNVIMAGYVNKHGEIKREIFYPCDWRALESELAKENK